MHNVFHVSLLKHYFSDGELQPLPLQNLDVIDNDPVFKVSHLVKKLKKRLRKHGSRRVTEYLVKWEGYSDLHNSWEPAQNILDKNLIKELEERLASRT
jgi:hypothetical protein